MRRLAPIHQLAPNKVHRLDAVGALINRSDTHIARILRSTRLLNEAHTTMHLHTDLSHFDARIRAKSLGDRREQSRPRRPVGLARGMAHINRHSIGHRNTARRKKLGAHCCQHPPHIRMINNSACAARNRRAPLFALFGISQRLLVSALAGANSLTTNAKPRVVHHRKHRGHTTALRTNKPASRAVILHHSCGTAVQTELMFKTDNMQAVRLAHLTRSIW